MEATQQNSEQKTAKQSEETPVQPTSFEQQWKRRKKKRVVKAVIAVVVVAVVGAFAVQGYRYLQKLNNASDANVSVLTYRVRNVTAGQISTTLSASGTLAAASSETLTAVYGGDVTDVLISAGDSVSEGDILLQIESDEAKTQKEALLAELDTLSKTMASATEYQSSRVIQSGTGGIVKDIKVLPGDSIEDVMEQYGYLCLVSTDGRMQLQIETNALKKLDRVTVTVEEDTLSGLVTNVTSGVATIQIDKNTYSIGQTATVSDTSGAALGNGTLTLVNYVRVTAEEGIISEIRVSENVQVWSASTLFITEDLLHASKYLNYLEQKQTLLDQIAEVDDAVTVRAPFSGKILEIDTAEGDTVLAGDTLLIMQSDGGYTVSLSVDELEIMQLKLGQTVEITMDALDGTYEGTRSYLSYVNTASGSARYTVTVQTGNIEGALAGMSATCSIVTSMSGDGLLVPVDAVQQVDGQNVVYLAPADASFGDVYEEDGLDLTLLTAVPVETGMSDGTNIIVTGDLSESDLIIVKNLTTTATYEEDDSATMFQFGGGTMDFSGMNMEDMPSGGNMPSGIDFSSGNMPSGNQFGRREDG